MKNKKEQVPVSSLFFSKTWDFLNTYLPKQAGRSLATVESYRDSLTIFKNYVVTGLGISIAAFQFSDCSKKCIYGFREYLLSNGSQPSTVNVRIAAIRSYLIYVADTDISVQPVSLAASQISPCKTVKKEKPVLNEEALSAILSAPPNSKAGMRDRLILILLYDTAVRISELLNIRLCDIALDTQYPSIFITGKGNKERTIQLTDKTVSHLKEYISVYHRDSGKDAYLIFTTIKGVTGKMSTGNVQRVIKKYAEYARQKGISLPESVHPHMFRRTRATNLYQDGVAIELVSTVLGHARTETTKNYYAKPSVEQLRKALESVPVPTKEEKPLWVGDEEKMSRLCGLR
jgi:integrase/recombinase XerD